MTKPLFIAQLSAIPLVDGKDAQILPFGKFKARDGRPGPGKFWNVTDAQGVKLAAEMTSIAQQSAFNFDYEHQTLNALTNGQPAPASGWATQFEWRPGQGLFALGVKWTDKARGMIDSKEYLYVSPLIAYDQQGNVTGVINAALVNTPAILGMEALAALSALVPGNTPPNPQTESNVNLLQLLIAALGIKADANETEAMAAVAALKSRADAQPHIPQPLAAALSIKADADLTVAVSAINSLKTAAAGTDKTTLDTIAALSTQVAELSAARQVDEVAKVIEEAMTGPTPKIVPATKAWAEDLGKRDLAALKSYLAVAPALPLGNQQSGGKDPGEGGGTAALSGMAAEVAHRMGLTAEQFNAGAA